MEQDKSHNITPEPDEMKRRVPRPKTALEKKEEEEQALISRDRKKVGKIKRKSESEGGPMSVGVDFDHSQG